MIESLSTFWNRPLLHFTQRFQLNQPNQKFFHFFKNFKMKKMVISWLHMSQTVCKSIVDHAIFFCVSGVFLFVVINIDQFEYWDFHYLEYSCGKFFRSSVRRTSTVSCLTCYAFKSFAFKNRNFILLTKQVLSANSSPFLVVEMSGTRRSSNFGAKTHFAFTHRVRVVAAFWSRETTFLHFRSITQKKSHLHFVIRKRFFFYL